ncbi:hypothetical protein DF186_23920, partial [Enterococcus hirae]
MLGKLPWFYHGFPEYKPLLTSLGAEWVMDILGNIGPAALGSRFRSLSEILLSDAAEIYPSY